MSRKICRHFYNTVGILISIRKVLVIHIRNAHYSRLMSDINLNRNLI